MFRIIASTQRTERNSLGIQQLQRLILHRTYNQHHVIGGSLDTHLTTFQAKRVSKATDQFLKSIFRRQTKRVITKVEFLVQLVELPTFLVILLSIRAQPVKVQTTALLKKKAQKTHFSIT